MSRKLGEILDPAGNPRWEVYPQTMNGKMGAMIERDAVDGSEDDVYASLSDLEDSLAQGFTFRLSVDPQIRQRVLQEELKKRFPWVETYNVTGDPAQQLIDWYREVSK